MFVLYADVNIEIIIYWW